MQRVLLALSLTPVPNCSCCDEPVSAVDAAGRDLFYQVVSDLRHRLISPSFMVSHDLAPAAAVADRMVFLDHRIVKACGPTEMLADPLVRRTFALDLPAAA